MTDLTRLLAHDMADGLRRGDFSARELTDAHLAAVEKTDRPLHAWVYVDADGARAQADAADKALRGGAPSSPLTGIPVALKDLVLTKGDPATAGSRILEGHIGQYDAHISERLQGRRRRAARQDEHGRVRHGLVDRVLGVGANGQPVGSRPRAGRQQRRIGIGRRRLPGAAEHRHGHGRLHPPAGGPRWHRRPETNVRAGKPLRHRRLRVVARPDRAAGPRRARRRDVAERRRRPRRARFDFGRSCRCRITTPSCRLQTTRPRPACTG